MSNLPSIAVLMGTRNGERWLDEQIDSIHRQRGVAVGLVVSDDGSTDGTSMLLRRQAEAGRLVLMPEPREPLGTATRNFLRLIREAPIGDARFVALADQDDIWLPQKLARAVSELERHGADAYSGSVTAFWEDGRRRLVDKAGRQRRYDHLFESPGPGCSFVFPRAPFERLRAWVAEAGPSIAETPVHDWLIYAYARESGWRWIIDPQPQMLYRQHEGNVYGANLGRQAAQWRLRRLLDGTFRLQILKIADAVRSSAPIVARLRRFSFTDRLMLMLQAPGCRRRPADSLALAATLLAMRRL